MATFTPLWESRVTHYKPVWGRNSCVGSVGLAALRDAASRVCPSSEPPVDGVFPLEFTWVLTPFPKTLSDESMNRGPLCAPMHSIVRTQNILTFMS